MIFRRSNLEGRRVPVRRGRRKGRVGRICPTSGRHDASLPGDNPFLRELAEAASAGYLLYIAGGSTCVTRLSSATITTIERSPAGYTTLSKPTRFQRP